jgi:hypothetical protein
MISLLNIDYKYRVVFFIIFIENKFKWKDVRITNNK